MIDRQTILNQLYDVYNIVRHTSDFEAAIEKLNGPIKIHSLVRYYINVVDVYEEIDKEIIEMIVRILQEIYNNAANVESPITDEDYDKLYEINRQENGEEIVGASVGEAKNRVITSHKYPDLRGTLDKIHFIKNSEKKPGEKRKSLEDWKNSIIAKLGNNLPANVWDYVAFPKWDGISGIFECDSNGDVLKVLKRGDTTRNEAEEMTEMFIGTNMKDVNPFKNRNEFGVKTEIIMSRDNYEIVNEKYGPFKSPRSAVSSIMNSKILDRKFLKYLTAIPLQVQDYETKQIEIPEAAYTEYPAIRGNMESLNGIHDVIRQLQKAVEDTLGIDIDGVVFRLESKTVQAKLGRDGAINKYEVAYKFPPAQKKTRLKDVEFSVGVLGAVTPVAKIEPVKIKGNTISNISLGSMDRFESLGLREGDIVSIKYDVIPYLDKVPDEEQDDVRGELFVAPRNCPYCNQPLEKQPVLRCINDDCESRQIGKIVNYVTKLDIPNISIGTVTTLYNEGIIKSISDLYELDMKKNQIVQLEGFGAKSYQNLIDGINSRKEVYDYELIGSIGITDVGRKMFKKIFSVYTLDQLIEICENENVNKLTKLAGIKEKTAWKIIEGINKNIGLIGYLRSRLKVKQDNREYTIKVAFTKVRDKDFEKYLDTKDVLVMDSYNKSVDMLIVPDYQTSSSKVEKAQKDGKEIVSIDDAYKMFEYDTFKKKFE